MRHIDPGRPLLGLDDATVRFLEAHRLRAIAIPGRSWRDFGDGVMLYSSSEPEPFFNRLAAVRWPEAPAAFDNRLRQVVDLFGAVKRRPYIWTMPGATTPADVVARLEANGFADQGGGLDMLLVNGVAGSGGVAEELPTGARLATRARLEHWHDTPPDRLAERAEALAVVVADAFGIPSVRHKNLVAEIALTLTQPNFHAYMVTVDGEPAATGQRYTFDGASYLSSIGTRPAWRGRGLGTAVTRRLAVDSIGEGIGLVYLAVEADNRSAVRLYEKLGFAALGPRSADMLAQPPTARQAR